MNRSQKKVSPGTAEGAESVVSNIFCESSKLGQNLTVRQDTCTLRQNQGKLY